MFVLVFLITIIFSGKKVAIVLQYNRKGGYSLALCRIATQCPVSIKLNCKKELHKKENGHSKPNYGLCQKTQINGQWNVHFVSYGGL